MDDKMIELAAKIYIIERLIGAVILVIAIIYVFVHWKRNKE